MQQVEAASVQLSHQQQQPHSLDEDGAREHAYGHHHRAVQSAFVQQVEQEGHVSVNMPNQLATPLT